MVEVFLGDPIEDRNELHVLNRLRADLERLSVSARIYANFVAGKQQLQVDLFIVTATRLVHAELKNLDVALPLAGKANGPWRQLLPDGTERTLDRNYYRQAHQATYALSDVMHLIASHGEAPSAVGKFYKHIDTVLCFYPAVPTDSRLETYPHVAVVGYDDLIVRLQTPHQQPEWNDEHWDAFARELGVYRDGPETPAERARRASTVVIADYSRRFGLSQATDLHALVPLAADIGGGRRAHPVDTITAAATQTQVVTLIGNSGTGKTHAARHAAINLSMAGHVPIWVRCAEYEQGRFSVLLARAIAPYTTERPLDLLERALAIGRQGALILDGFNECPAQLRGELLEQLAALRLRLPVAAIITSTEPVSFPAEATSVHIVTRAPDADERKALLSSYGASALPGDVAFATPLELALAAECARDLPKATRADVFDAYVRLRANREEVRAALRRLAADMVRRVRASLTVPDAFATLRRAGDPVSPEVVDATLRCPLLVVGHNRVAFTHELLGWFLAAEDLVLACTDSEQLGRALHDPRHWDLRDFAVVLERNDERRHQLLRALSNVDLLFGAARGRFGMATQAQVRGDICSILSESRLATGAAAFEEPPDRTNPVGGRWRIPRPRSDAEHALLVVAGRCLRRGMFTDEVAALLDATDARCAEEIRRLQTEGSKAPISTIVQATYAQVWSMPDERDCLPASVAIHACDLERMSRWNDSEGDLPLATAMWRANTTTPRWGRLYAALLLINSNNPKDLTLLPALVGAAWAAKGYHLRLAALISATDQSEVVDDLTRERIRVVLSDFDVTSNIMLSSALVEALAAYDAIGPVATLDDILHQISEILANQEDPLAWSRAQSIIGLQFDNEAVFGPYGEAIDSLDNERMLRLCVMAARAETMPLHRDWVLRQIVDRLHLADDATRDVLRSAATIIDKSSAFWQEAVQGHLEGLRGWALLADRLPERNLNGAIEAKAWRLFDELLFALEKGEGSASEDSRSAWEELMDLCAPAAVDVLFCLHAARPFTPVPGQAREYDRLVNTYPGQVLRLLEWGLTHRERLLSTLRHGPGDWRERYIVAELGRLGNVDTGALLQTYLPEPGLGDTAIAAIREIERRHSE